MRISVVIPCYEMNDMGHIFLAQSLDKLVAQEFKDFEVIISDNSNNSLIENLCKEYSNKLDIKYFKNSIRGSSANTNNGIRHAKGELIKFLFQDDFLLNEYSLKIIDVNFKPEDNWLITACETSFDGVTLIRPFYPMYNDAIHLGNNTISSPSVLTIRNKEPLMFDEKSMWLMDVDYYKRLYDKYGEPKIIDTIAVVNRIGSHQVSNSQITDNIIKFEYEYMKKKHNDI